jgi:threonine/homoserine/homoserine lactone efflux protein
MLTALIIGSILGFILAMPPGPIAMASIRLGLEKGRRSTFQMSIGTASLDTIYCLMAVFAASAIQNSIMKFFENNPLLSLLFQLSIVLLLVVYGFYQFKKKQPIEQEDILENKTPDYLKRLKNKGPFLLGIALALTNIANPTFLPSLAVMSAWVQKMNLFEAKLLENLVFSFGFGIGNFLWLYLLGFVVSKNKHKISDQSLHMIRQFAGFTFIGFAGWIGYRVVLFTNWANVFKFIFAF